MRVLSLFSGAGGLDLGLEAAGMTAVGMCELDPTARTVLARRWPNVPLHDDVTTLDPEEFRGRVDLVAGGSPCQDLSVAGRRSGLDGARSGLFWHQCRIADQAAAPWVLWENVGGALSSNDGADFAAVLWGLTGTHPGVPDGGWRTAGVVVGPKRSAVWRLLDAQWFGVAQRRRRVFVVAGPRGLCGPEVLLEPESCTGHPPPSRSAGQGVAALTANGVGTCGADDNQAQAGHLIPDTIGTLTTAFDAKNYSNLQEVLSGSVVAFDTTQITSAENRSNPQPGDPCHPLAASAHPPAIAPVRFGWSNPQPAMAVALFHSKTGDAIETAGSLTTNGGGAPEVSQGTPLAVEPVAFDEFHTTSDDETHHTLKPAMAVRRLTPRECERLMGWPDDHTRYTADGREVADSNRYRMIGNGVVAPVAEWIGRRIVGAS